ncbi:MAG: hypothetical protein MPJ05_06895 [Nitrosopumilus sp.]|nr:hypothetical protein [Nitrosopumilus sp.]MDA7942459.1 hypothetical protein [Nitrosopumilus sp.]MDA7953524.1 hypothetical protein [Nitrosopumilus sp.]
MGYLRNHLATVSTAAFAAVLTAIWPPFVEMAPQLDPIFLMAVPITWFMALTCWLAQKSTDYVHGGGHAGDHGEDHEADHGGDHGEGGPGPDLGRIKSDLSAELDEIREASRLKDGEIERLKKEISNLQTMVQIESLKAELADLKALASRG